MSTYGLIITLALIAILLVVVYRQRRRIAELDVSVEGASGGNLIVSDAVKVDVGSEALFATFSHELRTPLNGLLGIVQMLNEEKEDEDLDAIEGCARHMLAVISTLVNHSKIQAEWEDLPEYREWSAPTNF